MRRLKLAKRELSSLRAEKTIILALLIQLVIAAFSSFLVVGLVSLYDPGSGQVDFGVTGDIDSLLNSANNEDAWSLTGYESQQAAIDAFENGDIDAVLTVENRGQSSFVTVIAPRSDIRSTLIISASRELLQRFEEQKRGEVGQSYDVSLLVPPDAESTPYHGFTYAVLIPMLMFLPVFISGSIASDSITEEYERGTIDLLRVSPLSEAAIFDGKTLTAIGIAPMQAAIWLTLLMINGVRITHPILLLLMVTSISVIAVGYGAVVANIFRERKQAQFTYSVGIISFLVLTFALPESSPNTVAKLAAGSITPVTMIHIALYALLGIILYITTRRVATKKSS